MKLKSYLLSSLLLAGFVSANAQLSTFNFTGGIQTFTVPCGVDSVFIQTWGAQGGSGAAGGNSVAGGNGGNGGYAEGWLVVAPGDVLNIFVGGQGGTPTGGFNGGANGGSQNAGGGGGASDVRVGGTAEANRVITAGGGGGGGRGGCHESSGTGGTGGNGGSGGGGVGANGNDSPQSTGVAGGGKGGNFGSIQGAFGAKGVGCAGFSGSDGATAVNGTGGAGGAGQTCCCSSQNSIVGGGGGGGGQLGGGGGGGGSAGTSGCSGNSKGAGGGGGGGSSYTGGVLSGTVNPGIQTGNGMVQISWTPPVPPAHTITGASSICETASTNYSISADLFSTVYTWTVPSGLTLVSGQNTTTISVAGATAGSYMIYVQGVNATCSLSGPVDSFAVTVNAAPTVAASANPSAICAGSTAGLTVQDTSNSYVWNPGSIAGDAITVTPASTTTYTVTGTNTFGCIDSNTVTVTVNSIPAVTLTPQSLMCLADGAQTLNGTPSGGVYIGPGISGNNFDPATAGAGTHSIAYTYTDVNGCVNSDTASITVDVCTSVAGILSGNMITISPNPAVEVLHVTWGPQADVKTIRVMDVTGKTVITESVNGGNSKTLDVTALPAGNYSVSVEGTESKSSFTFVKQ